MKRHHPSEQVATARCAVCEPGDDLPRQRSEENSSPSGGFGRRRDVGGVYAGSTFLSFGVFGRQRSRADWSEPCGFVRPGVSSADT
jgi:hypothetical protein